MTTRSARLARSITCASSKQSYLTAKLMVDRGLKDDCYRAYGYFRWVDDMVDVECQQSTERRAFMQRQIKLAETLYNGAAPIGLSPEEEMLADLIHNDRDQSPLLYSYITNFLAIIAFDAERKGRPISAAELDWYAATLGQAVTDGIQYFVCNGHFYPEAENRYLAATAAHITHMLRDFYEDLFEGYYNFPGDILILGENDGANLNHPEMRAWVAERVTQARQYFADGKAYLDSLTALRCKIVGYWYCARFERILTVIEADDYALRPEYAKPNKVIAWTKFIALAIKITGQHHGCKLIKIALRGRSKSLAYPQSSRIEIGPVSKKIIPF